MAKRKINKHEESQSIEFKFRIIEISEGSYFLNPDLSIDEKEIVFEINVGFIFKEDVGNITMNAKSSTFNNSKTIPISSLELNIVFNIEDFVAQFKIENKIEIPIPILEVLTSIGIGTLRGAVYEKFKGSQQKGIQILPVVDARQLLSFQ